MLELFSLIEEYGFTLAFAGVSLYFLIKLGNIGLDYVKNKSGGKIEDIEIDLTNHQLFSEMEHTMLVRIPNLPIQNEFKKKVFTDILLLKYKHFKNGLYEFVLRKDLDIISKSELFREFKTTFDNIVSNCLKEAHDKGIPKIAIDKFMSWHSGTIENTSAMIKEFCYSEYFYTNTSRVSGILSAYNVEFLLTITDMEKTIDSINGDLQNLEYAGLICNHH